MSDAATSRETPDSEPDLSGLRAAWSKSPPEPDIREFIHPDRVSQSESLLALLLTDVLERQRRGLPWGLNHFQAVLPNHVKPGNAASRLLIELELKESDPAELKQRLGDVFEQDIDAVVAEAFERKNVLFSEAAETATTHGTAPQAPSFSDYTGQRIGPYTIRTRLGAGGFGHVWKADRRSPDMTVAIKLLRRDRMEDASRARFMAEAQALARLDHGGIARIYEAGIDDGTLGDPYIVMEYIEGEPITKYCDRRRLSIDQRLALMAAVSEAVHHAHVRQLLHRDIKPSNILVTEVKRDPRSITDRERRLIVGREGEMAIFARPKLVDFGLAKSLSPNVRLSDQSLTEDLGKLMGTLEYMAPEQTSHDPLTVDTRADIFALGVVLYELVAGVLPLTHDELVRRALDEAIATVRSSRRPDPSTQFSSLDADSANAAAAARGAASRERLARLLRGRVRHVVGTAIQIEKEHRYSSAATFARDIYNYLEDEPFEEAAAEPIRRRLWLTVRRHPGMFAASAAVLIAISAGLLGVTWQWRRASALNDRLQESNRHVIEMTDAAVDLATLLASPQTDPSTGQREDLNESLDRAVPALESLIGLVELATAQSSDISAELPGAAASVYKLVGNIYGGVRGASLGDASIALEYFTRAIGEREKALAIAPDSNELKTRLSDDYRRAGDALRSLGRIEDALEHYNRGFAIAESVPNGPSDRTMAIDLLSVAQTRSRLGELQPALQLVERSLAIRERRLATEATPRARRDVAVALSTMADILASLGRTDEAIEARERGIVLRRRLLSELPESSRYQRDLAIALWQLANAQSDTSPVQASNHLAESAALLASLHEHEPTDRRVMRDLGLVRLTQGQLLLAAGRPMEAEREIGLALETFQDLLQIDPDNDFYRRLNASTVGSLGRAFLELDDPTSGILRLEQSAKLWRSISDDATTNAFSAIEAARSSLVLAECYLDQFQQGVAVDSNEDHWIAKARSSFEMAGWILDNRATASELASSTEPIRQSIEAGLVKCNEAKSSVSD